MSSCKTHSYVTKRVAGGEEAKDEEELGEGKLEGEKREKNILKKGRKKK